MKSISNNINFDEIEIHLFEKKLPSNLKFDSTDKDLNDFLFNESINYFKSNLTVIYLVFYKNKIIAFFSLSSDSIKIHEKLDIKLRYYPSMKIGRLAVDKEYQKSGIGTWIIKWIISYTMYIRKTHGIRFISVDAYNNKSILNFYTRNNFLIYGKAKDNMLNIPMYLDINKFNHEQQI